MERIVRALGCAALALTTAVLAGQSLRPERLIAPRLEDWKIGYYRADAQQSIREEVPRQQTVDDWQRMVTTQRFAGLAAKTTPADYLRRIATDAPTGCPGARSSRIVLLKLSGHAAARLRVDCPSNPAATGQPDTTLFLAIAGQSDMHVKQVAFRGGLGPADLPWAERFLSGVAFCAAADRAPACTR